MDNQTWHRWKGMRFHRPTYYLLNCLSLNCLWPNNNIWYWRFWSTLVQVMTCCLTAPSHYLYQCWLIFNEVLWHSLEGNYTGDTQQIYPWYVFEIYLWVKTHSINTPNRWPTMQARHLTGVFLAQLDINAERALMRSYLHMTTALFFHHSTCLSCPNPLNSQNTRCSCLWYG